LYYSMLDMREREREEVTKSREEAGEARQREDV
jgi:hypothetical protein